MRGLGVVILQGSDAATISHQVSQIARCTVPISDIKLYPDKYVRTLAVHCKICGSRNQEALMILCEVCNMGYHTFCLPAPLDKVPDMRWKCDVHRWHSNTKSCVKQRDMVTIISCVELCSVRNWRVSNARRYIFVVTKIDTKHVKFKSCQLRLQKA